MQDNLTEFFTPYLEWMGYVAIASLIFFVISLIFIPKIIAAIPSNYFMVKSQPHAVTKSPITSLLLSVLRNIIGVFLIFCGLVMLLTPGQGVLTILAGIFILDFPGKFKLELFLVKKPGVLKTLNWIRRKQNAPDFLIPE